MNKINDIHTIQNQMLKVSPSWFVLNQYLSGNVCSTYKHSYQYIPKTPKKKYNQINAVLPDKGINNMCCRSHKSQYEQGLFRMKYFCPNE